MNPELLLAHFNHISDAPGAIPRLRQFVLELAVRGKLVPQDPKDEPASALLRRIQLQKARLVDEGKINREKPPIPSCPKDLSFDLRSGWEASRFSQLLVELQTGPFGSSLHQSDYKKGGVPVINPASIKNGRLVPLDTMAVGPSTLQRLATFKLRAGDIVMARRGEMGRCAVVTEREDGWLCGTGSLILRLPDCMFPPFLVTLIGSPFVREYLGGSAVGSTMQNLNQSILLDLVIGLPPLAEQHRIVAKVDELMALCDRLEVARAERESRRDRLTAASHHHLNNGAEANVLRKHAHFFIDHLARLTARTVQIKQLRQLILNFAVRGQLVRQDPNDDSVPELLKRILAKRERLRSARKSSTKELTTSIHPTDEPFTIPAEWQWTRLGNFVESMTNGIYKPSRFYSEKGTACVRMYNIQNGCLNLSKLQRLELTQAEIEQYRLESKDILINRVNSRELVGKAAIVYEPREALVFEAMNIRLRLIEKEYLADYVNIVLRTSRIRAEFHGDAKQAVGQASVSQPQIANIMVPLPPLAEQQRIVAKVEELMTLCDRLEAQLTSAQTNGNCLLEAVLYHALNSGDFIASQRLEDFAAG